MVGEGVKSEEVRGQCGRRVYIPKHINSHFKEESKPTWRSRQTPEHELMQLRMSRAWSRPQTVGSGSVPFWALSKCEAKEWVRHQAADYPSNECVRQGPWSARKQVTAELTKKNRRNRLQSSAELGTRRYARQRSRSKTCAAHYSGTSEF
jgi:hypothetical protein